MKRLAEELVDPELSDLYSGLLASEARHHATYVDLALERYPREEVLARIAVVAAHEAATISGNPEGAWLHDRCG